MNGKDSSPPWQERQMRDGSICFTVKTLGVVSIAQDGFAAAERCRKTNPRRARWLTEMAETLLSAAVVVLRHEEAKVPEEVLEAISELMDALRVPVVRRQRGGHGANVSLSTSGEGKHGRKRFELIESPQLK